MLATPPGSPRGAHRLDDSVERHQTLLMAHHVAELYRALRELVPTNDDHQRGPELIRLLELALEGTALVVRLGAYARPTQLVRDREHALAQVGAGIRNVDARFRLVTELERRLMRWQPPAK